MGAVIARVLLAAAALAAAAWVAASLQGARLEARAGRLVAEATGAEFAGARTPADKAAQREKLVRAARLLERARKWAPYQTPVDFEAGLLYRTGERRRGLRLLRGLLDREPENSDAWEVYASLLRRGSAERARALRRVRELSPPVSER
jgi:predicted Zn-dependent protease